MPHFDKQAFTDIELEQLHDLAAQYKGNGWRYSNTHALKVEGDDLLELIYTFSNYADIVNLRMTLHTGDHIPSISDIFFNAFVFENETHDLFGIVFDGIAIDFGGHFYTVSLTSPMNPQHVPALQGDPTATIDAACASVDASKDQTDQPTTTSRED
jgi:hypothetical protein